MTFLSYFLTITDYPDFVRKIDKEPLEVVPAQYDIRLTIDKFKKVSNINGAIKESDLPRMKIRDLVGLKKKLVSLLNSYPPYNDQMYTGRDRTVPFKDSILHPKAPLDTEK